MTTTSTDRARMLTRRSSEAATIAGASGLLAVLLWVLALTLYAGTAPSHHVGTGAVLAAVVALVASLLCAAFAAASYVLGSFADAENAG